MTSDEPVASSVNLTARSWRVPPIRVTQNSTGPLAGSVMGIAKKTATTVGNPPAASREAAGVRRWLTEAQLPAHAGRTVAAARPLAGKQRARLPLLLDPSGAMSHEL